MGEQEIKMVLDLIKEYADRNFTYKRIATLANKKSPIVVSLDDLTDKTSINREMAFNVVLRLDIVGRRIIYGRVRAIVISYESQLGLINSEVEAIREKLKGKCTREDYEVYGKQLEYLKGQRLNIEFDKEFYIALQEYLRGLIKRYESKDGGSESKVDDSEPKSMKNGK